jgi:hypothetical protein
LATPWTEGRLKAFVIAVLRSGTRRYPPKYETLKDAYVGQRLNEKTNREGKHYLCALCEGEFPAKEVEVDHIEPVISSKGFTSWDDYIARLFCDKSNLQVVCKSCHKIKSYNEGQERKLNGNQEVD